LCHKANLAATKALLEQLCRCIHLPCRASSSRAFPTKAPEPPIGTAWVHEIQHDGIRVIALKDENVVRLYSRSGDDITRRFPLIVDALVGVRARSCILDGEAVACGDDGIAVFERIRYMRYDHTVFLYAFDLIELNGHDLRREPLETRKTTLASLLARAGAGVRLNEHLDHAEQNLTADAPTETPPLFKADNATL
jgi:ATP-dependent DNA ligase